MIIIVMSSSSLVFLFVQSHVGRAHQRETPPVIRRQMDAETASRIAESMLEDDDGPDLDSLIDRMLTLTPSARPSDMMLEAALVGEGESTEKTVTESVDSIQKTQDSEDTPPELPPKLRQANGDLLHSAENGSIPTDVATSPPPVVPPRRKHKQEKDNESVRA